MGVNNDWYYKIYYRTDNSDNFDPAIAQLALNGRRKVGQVCFGVYARGLINNSVTGCQEIAVTLHWYL